MSRFHEGDGENPIQYVWSGNVERILRGKRGQRILRELCEALLALPERRLIANKLENKRTGEVCTIGALAKYRGVLPSIEDDGDDELTRQVGEDMGLGFMLTWELGYMNDSECYPLQLRHKSITLDVPVEAERWYGNRPSYSIYATIRDGLRGYSPEERWEHVYRWACSRVQKWNLPVPA